MRPHHFGLSLWVYLFLSVCWFVSACSDGSDQPLPPPAEQSGGDAGTDGSGNGGLDTEPEPTVSECSDGADNDGDGLVDWQLDLGCTGPDDGTEGGLHDQLDQGWTVFEAGPNTTIYYVSSSTGDDAWSGLAPEWNGTDGPKQTPAAAIALMQDGKPDWLLFKRGDVWVDQTIGNWAISGASADRPVVIATYGDSTQRPRFEVQDHWLQTTASSAASAQRSHVRILGIHVYMYSKDPDDSRFNGLGGSCLRWLHDGGDVLVEDIKCEYAPFALQSQPTLPFTVRRSVFTKNYGVNEHAQNMYTEIAAPLTIEQNVFNHGGWNNDFRLALWAPEVDPAVWSAVSDGRFGVNLAGTHFDIADVDLSSATDMQAVASTLEAAINAAAGTDVVRLLFTEGGAFQLRAPGYPRAPGHPSSDYYAVTAYAGAEPGTDIDDLFNTASQGSPEGTVFNRNMYLACGQGNTVVRGNIDANGASGGVQQRMGGVNEDNLFLRNPHAVVFGSVQNLPNSYVGGVIRNNVVLGSRDIDTQVQGSGLLAVSSATTQTSETSDLELCGAPATGEHSLIRDLEINGNILAHNVYGTFNFKAISLQGDGPHQNVEVHDNIIYDWARPVWPNPEDQRAFGIRIACASDSTDVEVHHNIVQQPNGGFLMIYENDAAGVSLHDNTYWSTAPNPPDTWSRGWFSLSGRAVTMNDWLEATDESAPIDKQVQFVDPNRTIETYMASLSENASYDAFIEQALLQSKYNWRTKYTAEAVNAYIRAGFTVRTPADSQTLVVRYDGWSDGIIVENKHIRHVQTRHEFDDSMVAVPTGSHTVVLVDADLTQSEYDELVRFIRDSGFESLAPAYGAPVNRRHYPYVLTIGFGDDHKVVTYRSNPSYEEGPESFRQVEEYVMELSRRVRSRLSG